MTHKALREALREALKKAIMSATIIEHPTNFVTFTGSTQGAQRPDPCLDKIRNRPSVSTVTASLRHVRVEDPYEDDSPIERQLVTEGALRQVHALLVKKGLYPKGSSAFTCGRCKTPIGAHQRVDVVKSEDGDDLLAYRVGQGMALCKTKLCVRCQRLKSMELAAKAFGYASSLVKDHTHYFSTLTLPNAVSAPLQRKLLGDAYVIYARRTSDLEVSVHGDDRRVLQKTSRRVKSKSVGFFDYKERCGLHGYHIHELVSVEGGPIPGTDPLGLGRDTRIAHRLRRAYDDADPTYTLADATAVVEWADQRYTAWEDAVYEASTETLSASVKRARKELEEAGDGVRRSALWAAFMRRSEGAAPAWALDLSRPQYVTGGRLVSPAELLADPSLILATREHIEASPEAYGVERRRLPEYEGMNLDLSMEAFDIQSVQSLEACATYLSKVALELTLSSSKTKSKGAGTSRTALQLAADVAYADEQGHDYALLREYWAAEHGKTRYLVSPSAREAWHAAEPVELPRHESAPEITDSFVLPHAAWIASHMERTWVDTDEGLLVAPVALSFAGSRDRHKLKCALSWTLFLEDVDRTRLYQDDYGVRLAKRRRLVELACQSVWDGVGPPMGEDFYFELAIDRMGADVRPFFEAPPPEVVVALP